MMLGLDVELHSTSTLPIKYIQKIEKTCPNAFKPFGVGWYSIASKVAHKAILKGHPQEETASHQSVKLTLSDTAKLVYNLPEATKAGFGSLKTDTFDLAWGEFDNVFTQLAHLYDILWAARLLHDDGHDAIIEFRSG